MNLESISRLSRAVPPPVALKAQHSPSTDKALAPIETTRNIAQYQKMVNKLRALPEIRPEKIEEARAYLKERGPISDADAAATSDAIFRELGTALSDDT